MTYKFTGEKNEQGLKRIIRSDGEIGGWIESKKNLDILQGAWVYDNAMVYGNAMVNFDVEKTTDYFCIGPIGTRDAFLTFAKNDDILNTGCFSGTYQEFMDIAKTEDYLTLVPKIKEWLNEIT